MPFHLGVPELIVVLVIVMIIFGVGRLGEFGAALGRSIREFRRAVKDDRDDTVHDKKNEATSEAK